MKKTFCDSCQKEILKWPKKLIGGGERIFRNGKEITLPIYHIVIDVLESDLCIDCIIEIIKWNQ